jgi:uncharacterized delta-60 repeat protein
MMNLLKIPIAGMLMIAITALVSGCGGSPDAVGDTGQYFLLVRYNPDGTLDPQFNGTGIVYTFFPYKSETGGSDFSGIAGRLNAAVEGIVFDKNKHIIAAGWALVDQKKQIAAARYISERGVLDEKFANAGKAIIDYPKAKFSEGKAITLDNEGRILIAGYIQRESGPNYCDFIILRLNESGQPDDPFGTHGRVVASYPDAYGEIPCLISVNTQGIIIAAGTDDVNSNHSLLLAARYNPSGTPDGTFGENGIKVFDFPPEIKFSISDVTLDAAGHLIAIGWINLMGEKRVAMVRFTPHGKLDADFGTAGLVVSNVSDTKSERAAAVIVDSKGRIIVAGETGELDGQRRIVLARLNMKGTLEKQFGKDGIAVIDIPESVDERVEDIAADPNGRIIVAGRAKTGDNRKHILLARFNENGVVDSTFNKTGSIMTDIPGAVEHGVNTVVVDPEGKILIGGWVVFD